MDRETQERIAHLERDLADLSDVVARQDREIETLTRQVRMLMARAAEQELDAGGTVPLADRKPPHW
ncbi:MAG: SlyX protein [Rhodobacteraceae bacterium HLUCCA08]|nr:MAG: SlyX protein [Rhodobacteraceae bacterium HLUCCA08]